MLLLISTVTVNVTILALFHSFMVFTMVDTLDTGTIGLSEGDMKLTK